jgi:hypothetical protein
MNNPLPNIGRNKESEEAISRLKEADTGDLALKPAGIASAVTSLNTAESLQLLQLQIIQTSSENRKALSSNIDKLIESNTKLSESNERQARAMKWLTGALVLVALAQTLLDLFKLK